MQKVTGSERESEHLPGEKDNKGSGFRNAEDDDWHCI